MDQICKNIHKFQFKILILVSQSLTGTLVQLIIWIFQVWKVVMDLDRECARGIVLFSFGWPTMSTNDLQNQSGFCFFNLLKNAPFLECHTQCLFLRFGTEYIQVLFNFEIFMRKLKILVNKCIIVFRLFHVILDYSAMYCC